MEYQPDERDTTLGFIVDNPALLDGLDIPDGFFRTDRQRPIWLEIKELAESRIAISLPTIAERVDGKKVISYLTAITSGLYPIKPEEFRRRVYKQSAHDVMKRMQSLAATAMPDLDELVALAEEARRLELAAEDSTGEDEAVSLTLSDVAPNAVPWLWQDFIPLGRATLISGDPGSAKTWFCLDLAARLSRGQRWPNGAPGGPAAKTYYMTVEDDLHDTVRPRIDSLGGDPAMISVYNSEHPLHMDLSTPEGLKRLERELIRIGDVRLVVIDPIIDFSGDSNPNAAEEVRALLTPLIRLAAKLNFALVLIGHLNKAQSMSAIYRAGGSTSGWLGKCRAAFMLFRDIDDRTLRHVLALKANLAPIDPPQLEFRITNGELRIEVSSEPVDVDEQLNPQRGPRPQERERAEAWLEALFGDQDQIPSLEVEEAARKANISDATLRRAKKKAGFLAVKLRESGGKVVWAWSRRSH